MKLKFKTQAYQTAAVQAVVDCFKGQPFRFAAAISYRIDPGPEPPARSGVEGPVRRAAAESFQNADFCWTDAALDNIQPCSRQNLPVSTRWSRPRSAKVNLDIEMETGTGKTYCYIKTIFRAEQAVRLEQVHHRGAQHCHP
jgi:type III restriction enzyme